MGDINKNNDVEELGLKLNVVDLFERAVSRFPNNACLDFLDKKMTYGEVGQQVNLTARGLQQLGVKKGVHVGLCLPNTPYSVICYYAILKIGGTVVNYNPLYAERELEHQINDSQTDIMITLDLKQIYPKVAKCLKTTCLSRIIVCSMEDILPKVKGMLFNVLKRSELIEFPKDPQHMSYRRLTNTDGKPCAIEIDLMKDIAVLQYTGGTTGKPKGAMLSHNNIAANALQAVNRLPNYIEGAECILGILPFFHVFAMTMVMNVGIVLAAEIILQPRFDLNQALKAIHKKRPTLFPAVPTIYNVINTAKNLSKYDLSSIKFCFSGGAPLPVEIKRTFEKLTGCVLVEGYGLSEASPVLSANPMDKAAKDGSIGLALDGTEIQIRDLDNKHRVLKQGEKGEVCARGPQIMQGYWRHPGATDETIIDGFLHTGDVGYIDEDGFIFLVDRIKDVILCGGYNVYPRAIEEALYLHPGILEATVIAIDDDYRGQAPKAFVKLSETHGSLSEADIKLFLHDKISRIEMPKSIEIRDELPKTMIGKLSKKELVAEEVIKSKELKAS